MIDERRIVDDVNAVVAYHNPRQRRGTLAEIFFRRCLDAGVLPYVVTKKTVFKWQEPFWATMKSVYDAKFKQKFVDAGIVPASSPDLVHLLSDAATMKLVVWTDGGFGMAAHNYDGDVLTDELAQVHKSPGFITSNLVGVDDNGTLIKEFEASHGTVTDMDEARLRGEETSPQPARNGGGTRRRPVPRRGRPRRRRGGETVHGERASRHTQTLPRGEGNQGPVRRGGAHHRAVRRSRRRGNRRGGEMINAGSNSLRKPLDEK